MIDIAAVLVLVLWLVVIGLIFWVIWWAVSKVGVPEPFNKIIQVVLVVAAALIAIYFLTAMLPVPQRIFR